MSKYITCPRCNGKGGFKIFMHVKGGVCFRCNGACVVPSPPRAESADEAYLRIEREAIIAFDNELVARENELADSYAARDIGSHEGWAA